MGKKMRDEGVLVPGAQPGRKGSGCFKLSAEEKARIADEAKSAAKKLKGVGKVKASKKVAKKLVAVQRKFQPRKLQCRSRNLLPRPRNLHPRQRLLPRNRMVKLRLGPIICRSIPLV